MKIKDPGIGELLSVQPSFANTVSFSFYGESLRLTFGETVDGENGAFRCAVILPISMAEGLADGIRQNLQKHLKTNASKNKTRG